MNITDTNLLFTVSFAAFMLMGKYLKGKDTTLFIDPGFPVQKQQHHALGIKYETFDVYSNADLNLDGEVWSSDFDLLLLHYETFYWIP